MADLKIEICGVKLKNPVIAASGTFGFGREYNEIYDISVIGGVSSKGMTLKPRLGNAVPRIAEGYGVILNAVGLQNPGVEHFIKHDLSFLREKGVAVIAQISGEITAIDRIEGTMRQEVTITNEHESVPHKLNANQSLRPWVKVGEKIEAGTAITEGPLDPKELLRVADSNAPYARAVIERVFDDANTLIAGANVVPERMIMQLLFPQDGNAGIAIRANGMEYVYNYDPKGTWKSHNYIELSGADLWSASATADPFAVFKAAKDKIRSNTGTDLTIAVMNTATFNMLSKTEAVKKRYLTTSGLTLGYLTDDEVKNVVSGTSRIQIAIYDKQYKDESGIAHAFVPDGHVAMIPAGDLGGTWYGTTPEEADLIASPTAEVELVNTGVAITRIIEEHPVNTNIFASEIVLPSYERMDEVAVIKVAGESAAALAAEENVQKTRTK